MTAITIDIARSAKDGVGGWAWIDDQGRRKARWMNTASANKLYRAALSSVRRDLGLHGQLTISVRPDADFGTRPPNAVTLAVTADGADLEQARRLAQRALTTGAGRRYTGPALKGKSLRVYCDGSFDAVTCVGGWAWYVNDDTYACDAITGARSSTEMEFIAAVQALRCLADKAGAELLTDCKILVEAVNGRSDGKSPKMRGELRALTDAVRCELARVRGHLRWVPSHSGVDGNTQADRAARGAVRSTLL